MTFSPKLIYYASKREIFQLHLGQGGQISSLGKDRQVFPRKVSLPKPLQVLVTALVLLTAPVPPWTELRGRSNAFSKSCGVCAQGFCSMPWADPPVKDKRIRTSLKKTKFHHQISLGFPFKSFRMKDDLATFTE